MKTTSHSIESRNLSRRRFLKTSGLTAGSLVVAFHLPSTQFAGAADSTVDSWKANAFLCIGADDRITVFVNQAEMGQGVYTALPMLVAEELDADWTKVIVEHAPVTPEYHHKLFGMRVTFGSASIMAGWEQLRMAGATARVLLVNAAAEHWQVNPDSLHTENSQVIHTSSGRKANYASLASIAATMPTPDKVMLKEPIDFKLIGTDVKRFEGQEKVSGKAQFGIDIKLPRMLTAVVAHPPVYGNKVKRYSADKALAVPGVIKVKQISTGVAVIAKDFWSAKVARDKLDIEWEQGPAIGFSTADLQRSYRELAEQAGSVITEKGDVDTALSAATKTLEAIYECPYLAHACMEPLSCTVQVSKKSCELWLGTQAQSFDKDLVAEVCGIKPEQVTVNGTLMGGGFGRRINRKTDYLTDAVEVAKNEGVPVKTLWTREEDIQGAYYRPLFTHKLTAGLNNNGLPEVWLHRLVGQSVSVNTPYDNFIKDGSDYASLAGAYDAYSAIANRRIELHTPSVPIPVTWWRGIAYTYNAFVIESFLDEVAHLGNWDPLALRKKLLADHPGHLRVLDLVAEKAGWGKPVIKGRAQGLAIQKLVGSCVAQVAEVSLTNKNEIIVHRVVCAVDCGIAINPLNIKAQIEGAIVFGLSAALYGEITYEDGKVQQSNFHDYPVLRMNAMPEIEVHIVRSSEPPTGIGEAAVPPIAPAVTNALFNLTGKRLRKLPIRL